MTADDKIREAMVLLAKAARELEAEFGAAFRPAEDARIAAVKADRRLKEMR